MTFIDETDLIFYYPRSDIIEQRKERNVKGRKRKKSFFFPFYSLWYISGSDTCDCLLYFIIHFRSLKPEIWNRKSRDDAYVWRLAILLAFDFNERLTANHDHRRRKQGASLRILQKSTTILSCIWIMRLEPRINRASKRGRRGNFPQGSRV